MGISSVVELESVSVTFSDGPERVSPFHGLSLNVTSGEFVAVEGPSGSGKTTLLRLIAGLQRPDSTSQRAVVDGFDLLADVDTASLRLASVGYVAQESGLVDFLTIEENVRLVGYLGGPKVSEEEALHWLSRMSISDLRHRLPSEVSGGQRQRAAIARALVKSPALMIADEPTGALDAATSASVGEALRELANEVAVIFASHDPLMLDMAERTIDLSSAPLDG